MEKDLSYYQMRPSERGIDRNTGTNVVLKQLHNRLLTEDNLYRLASHCGQLKPGELVMGQLLLAAQQLELGVTDIYYESYALERLMRRHVPDYAYVYGSRYCLIDIYEESPQRALRNKGYLPE
jgi:hypothetical protein